MSHMRDPLSEISGDLARLIREHDWSASPAGPIANWTPALLNTVLLMLGAQAEIVLFWGPQYVAFYNDAYASTIGDKHPQALGRPARENWSELWDDLEPLLRGVRESGNTFAAKDRPFFIKRRGFGETVYFDVSYSAARETDGTIGGVFCVVRETTQRVRSEQLIRDSEERLRLATENAGIGLFDIDAEGGINFSYSRRSSTFLMDRENRVPMEHLFSKLHPDDVSRTRAVYEAARDPARRDRFDVEYRVVPEENRPMRWIKVRGRGVFDDAGKLVRISGTAIDITKEQAVQDALRNSEEQLRLATEHAEIGMWDFDAINNRSYSHPRVKSMFGIPETEDPPPDIFFALVHPDDIARVLAAYADAMDPAKQSAYDVIYRVKGRDDGIQRWIQAKGRGVFDGEGNCVRVTGTAMDVTSEREIAEALSRSEEQLRLATDYSEIGLWDIDTVNDIVYWPPRVNVMFGYQPDESITMRQFRGSLHPDDKRKTIGLILDACDPAKRTFYDAEYRIVRKNDGAVRWMAAKGRAVFDDAGRCTRMLGVILDITEQKKAEQEVRDLNETLERKIIERTQARGLTWQVTPDLMGALNGKGYFETSNPAWQTVLGWSEEEVASMSIFELLHPDDVERTREGFDLTQIGQPAIRFPNRYRCKDGSYRWISWVGVPEDGMVYCTGRDITEEKAAEEKLAAAQAALQQAQKMEAIGNLTGGIAHDFNNLLQGLSGNLDLIRRKPDDTPRVKRWAESGLQAAERGAKLTAQLLAFSRSQQLELRALDLSELLPRMRELLTRTLGPSVEIGLDLEPGKQTVLGDETQLEMAVLNLAINARDAMPDGGRLSIITQSHTLADDAELVPGDYIEVSVSDTGLGMAPDIMARAFDPFFTTKGVGKGTGLGLSQVYGMIRQAGGTARIQSASGKGTTVSLYLRKTSQSESAAVRRDDDRSSNKAHAAKILVIDDDPGVRQFLNDSLSAFGYDVSEAENGPAGLSLIESFAPDLTVIDFAMPGMTGAEVAKKARRQRPDLPVIFASGYADTEAIESQRDEHTAVLRKPFRIGELQDAITRLLVR